jgi:hypothetical protein
LETVLAEALEKVELLKAKLEDSLETADADDAGLNVTTAAARAKAIRLRSQAQARAQEIRDAAEKTAEQKDQLIAGAARFQETMRETLETGKGRLADFSDQQATEVYAKLQEAVHCSEEDIPKFEGPEWCCVEKEEDAVSIPPLLSLIQGAFATSQIHFMKDSNFWVMLVDFVMLTVSAVTFSKDWNLECHDIEVWVWHIGLLTILTLDFLCRVLVVRWSANALTALEESREELEKENTGNSLMDTLGVLQRGSRSYFEPYFRYHSIADSYVFSLLSLLVYVNLCWGGFGVYISVADVVMDSLGCKAEMALIYMHVYSFLYLMFLTWNLLILVYMVVCCVASMSFVSGLLLRGAKYFDDTTMDGIPLALTIVQSFIEGNSSNAIGMDKREVQEEARVLNERLEEMERRIVLKRTQHERLAEAAANTGTQEEFLEKYQKATHQALEQAKPIVGLIASGVSTIDPDGPKPCTADTVATVLKAKEKFGSKAKRSTSMSVPLLDDDPKKEFTSASPTS